MAGQGTSFWSTGVSSNADVSPLIFLFFQPKFWPKHAIPKCVDIRGLLVKDTEIKLNQYADNTTLGTKKLYC